MRVGQVVQVRTARGGFVEPAAVVGEDERAGDADLIRDEPAYLLPLLFAHFNASVRAAVIANRASSRYCSFASGFNFDHNGSTSSKPMPDVPV